MGGSLSLSVCVRNYRNFLRVQREKRLKIIMAIAGDRKETTINGI